MPQAPTTSPVTAPDQATTALDPICGMEVKVAAALSTTHDGVTYRFCSAGCRERFVAEPDRYLVSPVETK